jgi:hypothetical protein
MRTLSSLLLSQDLECTDASHHNAISQSHYADAISMACLSAAETSIPVTNNRGSSQRIPGWTERVASLREKSMFWHNIWVDCGRPHVGPAADCMRRTRASYHYAIRQVRKDENSIVEQTAGSRIFYPKPLSRFLG